jgi:aquaporin Z
MRLLPKLLTELVGAFIFMTVIGLARTMGQFAPLAIGLALMAMVYMGGHISGAHYNPAVSFSLFLRRVIDARTMLAYWVTQLIAGVLAFSFSYAITGNTPGIRPGPGVGWPAALAAEIMFTTALALVVLNVAATKETAGNSFYGLAIGMTVAAGAFAVGPISGAVFNPAVGFGAAVVDAFGGHSSWSNLWLYVVGPFAGASIAAGIHLVQMRSVLSVSPEKSQRTG